METAKFLNRIYKHYGTRAIGSMHKKAHELLDTKIMGFDIRDSKFNIIDDFKYLGANLARALKQSITRDDIRTFLRSKESYQINIPPAERKSFTWTLVERPNIKWQMDTIYLGSWWKSQLGYEIAAKGKQKGRKKISE